MIGGRRELFRDPREHVVNRVAQSFVRREPGGVARRRNVGCRQGRRVREDAAVGAVARLNESAIGLHEWERSEDESRVTFLGLPPGR